MVVPGLPIILIGHNKNIAWSLTDTQNQAAFFYTERTSRARPDQYYWRGAWRPIVNDEGAYVVPRLILLLRTELVWNRA